MKLKESFVTQDIDDIQFLIPVGDQAFSGFLRNNETAAFIVNCLRNDTTEQDIIEKLWQTYDAPRETIAADLQNILNTLRKMDALEET